MLSKTSTAREGGRGKKKNLGYEFTPPAEAQVREERTRSGV